MFFISKLPAELKLKVNIVFPSCTITVSLIDPLAVFPPLVPFNNIRYELRTLRSM